MLEKFRKAKEKEIASLRQAVANGHMPAPFAGPRPSFRAALQAGAPLAIIAEYKRASPSRGRICDTLSVEEAARQYADAGAHALSILTEETWFQGRLAFLEQAATALGAHRQRPLLRKDFIFDPLQVRATAATPASALLLIVRLTPQPSFLRQLREEAEAAGIEAVVEVFDRRDLDLARESGATLIQVNARDLDTLQVSRRACLDLIAAQPPLAGETWIAASGIQQPEHLRQAAEAGFAAVLVGTALMHKGQPGQALGDLLAGFAAGGERDAH